MVRQRRGTCSTCLLPLASCLSPPASPPRAWASASSTASTASANRRPCAVRSVLCVRTGRPAAGRLLRPVRDAPEPRRQAHLVPALLRRGPLARRQAVRTAASNRTNAARTHHVLYSTCLVACQSPASWELYYTRVQAALAIARSLSPDISRRFSLALALISLAAHTRLSPALGVAVALASCISVLLDLLHTSHTPSWTLLHVHCSLRLPLVRLHTPRHTARGSVPDCLRLVWLIR